MKPQPFRMMMAAAILCTIHIHTHAQTIPLNSPLGQVHATIETDETHHLTWSLQFKQHPLVLVSPLGITIEAADLGQDVALGAIHRTLIGHYRQALISVTQTTTGIHYQLECRLYDNGFAYRYIVPAKHAKDTTLVKGEASSWRLPPTSHVWYQENVFYYEGLHYDTPIAALGARQLGPPVTYQTPDGDYASITEAALYNYSGMSLRSDSSGTIHAAFVNDPEGWKIAGAVTTPWRVILAAANLNDLVNTNLIPNLNPAPDSAAAHATWIKPGRAVWSYFRHDNVTTVELEKYYIDNAAALGFEYSIIDAGWDSSWPNALDSLRSLVAYAKQRHIRLFVWKSYASLKDDAIRKAFFRQMQQVGLAGLKIDYIDKEGIDQVRFYEQALKDGLATHLMIDFHGANKPTGLNRRFPNEITREGIYGQEWRTYTPQGPINNAIIPFTRFLAGPGDYTPGVFTSSLAYGTSRTQQLALPVIFNSPLLCWADDPATYLASPAANIIRSIPTTWDETRVLAPSKIGELVAFARRKGNDWFIAIINAGEEKQLELPLGFLSHTPYQAELLTDDLTSPDSLLHAITAYTAADTLSIHLRPKGGFIARLTPTTTPTALSIFPAGGYWQGPTQIIIRATPKKTIRYTTDGNEPTNSSPIYTLPLTINQPQTIKARVFTGDRPDPATAVAQFPAAPAPIASPAAGIFTTNGSIALSTNQKGPIRYTTDGSEPTDQSPLYHDPIEISNTTTIKSRIYFTAGGTSNLGSARYDRVAPDLAVSPASNQTGLQYSYYEGKWDSMPDLTKLEPKKQGAITAPDLSTLTTRPNEYALQFHGFLNVPETGVYTFYTVSDDGSLLFIGDEKVVDNDGCHGDLERSGDRALAAGRHPFTLNYFQHDAGQTLQVFIKGPHMEKQLLPAALLTH